ncbi:MAG TPA: hypothetical protein VN517_17645 [Terriglobales bacterium]|nr:hypothetical protein [Terriglobales bacterium]
MRRLVHDLLSLFALATMAAMPTLLHGADKQQAPQAEFHTSDRCLACHNGLTTPDGNDVSIGFEWRSSIMGNSARDPYWQASVRREDIDHPESKAEIEDGCADCHMPMARYKAKQNGKLGEVFAHLPFDRDPKKNASAEDGVTCSVCHQITQQNFGTRESFNGGFQIETPQSNTAHQEFGPFVIQNSQASIMQTSTGGFRPTAAEHVLDSALCATCHTLYTKSLAPGGKVLGEFPEQMPYQEWLHSDYPNRNTCQSCHMPEVQGPAPIAAVMGGLRIGVRQHTFLGGNFFVLRLLNEYRNDLSVSAMPTELTAEARRTVEFLQTQAARVTIQKVNVTSGKLEADILVENLTGHKLPTAFPSRRAWLHIVIRDHNGQTVFESGALNPDGSIKGNVNDIDGSRFEPHFREIASADQVEIYEPILRDQDGRVTTGLAAAVGYLKDNRLLPAGFNKRNAGKDIAVIGDAADDPNFTDAGDSVHYSVALGNAQRPFQIDAELLYQPIGFRWAHNLAGYDAPETKRMVGYYDSMPSTTAVILAHAQASF